MKKLYFLLLVAVAAFSTNSIAQDSKAASSQILPLYLKIKDALVTGNAATAATNAAAFVKATNGLDEKQLAKADVEKLVSDANKIAHTKDLKKQRGVFSSFSTNMIAAAKSSKLHDKPVYEAYCPMAKASWLSTEKAIKNPYYGSSMLTCGEVTSTIE